MLLGLAVSLVAGIFIFLIYKKTFSGVMYASGFGLAEMAAKVMLGISLRQQGVTGLCPPNKPRWYVKVPAFSFSKLSGVDAYLSPEMKSTGEAIGCDDKLYRAFYKALLASGVRLQDHGTLLVTLADEDKDEALPLIQRFDRLGFRIEATAGTAEHLCAHGVPARTLGKLSEGSDEILRRICSGGVSYIINTRAILSGVHYQDGAAIRRCAVENGITAFTSLDTVKILLDVLEEISLSVTPLDN